MLKIFTRTYLNPPKLEFVKESKWTQSLRPSSVDKAWYRRLLCSISSFCCEVYENCALLGHYPASSGNSLPTFRDNAPDPSSRIKNPRFLLTFREDLSFHLQVIPMKIEPISCPETLVRNYLYTRRNSPEKHSCQKALMATLAFGE
jgi:hypothetical protein